MVQRPPAYGRSQDRRIYRHVQSQMGGMSASQGVRQPSE